MSDKLFILQSQKKNTSHVLHLILSIITGGFWLIVWGCIAYSNHRHNKRIQGDMNRFYSYKAQGLTEHEAIQQEASDLAHRKKLNERTFIAIGLVIIVLVFINKFFG
jgi:hypothetical protein